MWPPVGRRSASDRQQCDSPSRTSGSSCARAPCSGAKAPCSSNSSPLFSRRGAALGDCFKPIFGAVCPPFIDVGQRRSSNAPLVSPPKPCGINESNRPPNEPGQALNLTRDTRASPLAGRPRADRRNPPTQCIRCSSKGRKVRATVYRIDKARHIWRKKLQKLTASHVTAVCLSCAVRLIWINATASPAAIHFVFR